MNTKERVFEIVNGPSKDLLFDACKYAYSKHLATIEVKFSVAAGYTMPPDDTGCAYIPMPINGVKIASIEHEDGSGESFNLKGYCLTDPDCLLKKKADLKNYSFEAYYNSKTRKGNITFTK